VVLSFIIHHSSFLISLARLLYSRRKRCAYLVPGVSFHNDAEIELMLLRAAFVVIAYLLGSVPFGYLLIKYVFTRGEDVRRIGSGGIGATNVSRRAGWRGGLLTYALDVAKGAAAVLLMRQIEPADYLWVGAAATAAIVGHVFPVFLKFKGGKGVATGVGVFLVLAPYAVLTTLVLWLLIVYRWRYVSLGSIIATAAVPLWVWLYYGLLLPDSAPHRHLTALVVIALAGCALIVAKHHENISRLLAGRENKIGMRVSSSDAAAGGGQN
jgi:acyl phosphate:glycerol-3-phosphate acyltransferase